MKYRPLGKLYYSESEAAYAEEYQKRFHSEEAIHLDFQIAGKQAFFLENTEVLKLAFHIAQMDKKVCQLSTQLPGVAKEQYSKKCLIDEIVLTNRIEGVHSSRKEIGEVLDLLQQQSQKKGQHTRFLGLVNKYFKLLSEEDIPLESCEDVRNIYDEVFLREVIEEDPHNRPDGVWFRKDSETVYSETGKALHQGVYPESEIIRSMEQALGFLKDESVEELYRICIFHYLIEYIHPFYDGNGRLGRFLLSYALSKTLEPLLAYRISGTIKEHISDYYKAFIICNDPHDLADLTPFLIMQLEIIYTAIRELEQSLREKLIRWNRYLSLIETLPNAKERNVDHLYNYLIQASLFSEEGIPTVELKALLEVSSTTTIRRLLNEIPQSMLVTTVRKNAKYYQLNLEELDDLLLQQELDKL